MTLSAEEIQKLNRKRIDENNREKAEAFKAKADSEAHNGWNEFLARHSGQHGLNHGVFHCFQANYQILEDWIAEQGLLVNSETLEQSFAACRSRLAVRNESYVRKVDLSKSRILPQQKSESFGPPELKLPYTKKEVLSWTRQRLRWECRTPERLQAINNILAGKQES